MVESIVSQALHGGSEKTSLGFKADRIAGKTGTGYRRAPNAGEKHIRKTFNRKFRLLAGLSYINIPGGKKGQDVLYQGHAVGRTNADKDVCYILYSSLDIIDEEPVRDLRSLREVSLDSKLYQVHFQPVIPPKVDPMVAALHRDPRAYCSGW